MLSLHLEALMVLLHPRSNQQLTSEPSLVLPVILDNLHKSETLKTSLVLAASREKMAIRLEIFHLIACLN